MPAVLVGTWDGGSNTSAAKITFFADGNVRLDYNNGQFIPATVVVSDSSMNLYLPGGRPADDQPSVWTPATGTPSSP